MRTSQERSIKSGPPVETILDSIIKNGDAAVKELAEKFDGYAPKSATFKSEIELAISPFRLGILTTSNLHKPKFEILQKNKENA